MLALLMGVIYKLRHLYGVRCSDINDSMIYTPSFIKIDDFIRVDTYTDRHEGDLISLFLFRQKWKEMYVAIILIFSENGMSLEVCVAFLNFGLYLSFLHTLLFYSFQEQCRMD